MVPIIDFEECLRDSPKFRATLEEQELDIEQLEHKLDKVLKTCGVMVDVGKTYVAQQSLFTNGLWDLSTYFRDDPDVMVCLNKLIHALQEMNKFQTTLLDQASRTVLQNLSSFVKKDIKGVKESRHYFEKISTDLDSALSRNSQSQKTRPADAEDTQNLLSATRSCFRHTALDYVRCISLVQAKKRHEVLGTLLSYMHACSTYFHQGTDLCQDMDPFFKKLGAEVVTMRADYKELDKAMEDRHSHVTSNDVVTPTEKEPRMEGYLFKRTSNAFKTWNRRWFSLQDSQLVYRKRTGEDQVTVMEDDLRLCSVKPVIDGERRFCFEVISPSKSHMLQADSEEMYLMWIAAMQHGIGAALQLSFSGNMSSEENATGLEKKHSRSPSAVSQSSGDVEVKEKKPRMWEQLLKIPGNNACCDCGNLEPLWASINLGITLCIECSGVHRSLGVHHSKVRSLTLDAWEPEVIKVMAELGNDVINKVYEADVSTSDVVRATPKCTGDVRKAWITAKYMERQFVKQLNVRSRSSLPLRKWSVRKLRRRTRSRDKQQTKMTALLENNVEVNTVNKEPEPTEGEVLIFGIEPVLDIPVELDSDQDSTGGEQDAQDAEEDISRLSPDSLLYRAAAAHNLPVMCEAYALGADKLWVNTADRGRSPIHQAIISGSVMACEYLLINGAKINAQDAEGNTPLHLATDLGHTAQVCLLLKHRADQHLLNALDQDAIAIAVKDANADIVTLLRLALLNEEMKSSELGSTGDDTFNDVVRDFTQLANTHPERLQRVKTERPEAE